MPDTITISIVSDVVCPWCIVGYKRLEEAIRQLNMQDTVHIEWEPFALNPHVPDSGEELFSHLDKKYSMKRADVLGFQQSITQHGADLGFTFDFFEGMKTYSTLDAHVLLEFAKDTGKQHALKLRFFDAYFTNHQNITDRQVLLQAIADVGLNVEEAENALEDKSLRQQVDKRKKHWRDRGVMSVPTMIFNNAYAINGAQPVEVYKEILREIQNTGRMEPLRKTIS